MRSLEDISRIGKLALREASGVHQELGIEGLQKNRINQHGEQTLRADFECEEAIIQVLHQHKLQVVIEAEEHGNLPGGRDRRRL